MNESARRCLAFADEDLQVAELTFGSSLWNQVCFHSHQCAEKSLKALVADWGGNPPRTHRLTDLLTLLDDTALDELADELRLLEGFYIPTRCPDALSGTLLEALPGEQEAKEALTAARRVSDAIREMLRS